MLNTLPMPLRRSLPPALALLAVALVPRAAGAQSLTLSGTTGTEWLANYKRDLEDEKDGVRNINRRDCLENPKIRFNLGLLSTSGLSGYDVQAWVGSACGDQNKDLKASSNACVKVGQSDITSSISVDIPVHLLVSPESGESTEEGTGGTAGTGGTDGSGGTAGAGTGGTAGDATTAGYGGLAGTGGTGGSSGTGGNGGTAGAEITDPGDAVCDATGTSTPTLKSVYFMLLNSDLKQPMGSVAVKWDYYYDLIGPEPPVDVSAGIGENALVLKWSEAEDASSDLGGYSFLCDPPPGGSTGIGAAGAAGADGSSEAPTDCDDDAAFKKGQPLTPSAITTYLCGDSEATGETAETDHLENFVPYHVGIVAHDKFKNYGVVSNVACAIPEPVTDFYEAYRAAGGKAGGGFCSIGTGRSHALTALVLAGALGLLARRQARRRRSSKDQA